MPFAATWMDLKIVLLSKGSQTEKENYHWTSLIYGIFKKKKLIQMNLTKQKETHRSRELTYGCLRAGEGIVKEFGTDMYTLLYLKWIANKDLLYSTWNCLCLTLCGSLDGRGVWGEWTHVYVWLSPFMLCCSLETVILLIRYTPIQNKKLKRICYLVK